MGEIESLEITETVSGKGSVKPVYTLLLKDGDPIEIPTLPHMAGFIEKLNMQYPQIEIKDSRSGKNVI